MNFDGRNADGGKCHYLSACRVKAALGRGCAFPVKIFDALLRVSESTSLVAEIGLESI